MAAADPTKRQVRSFPAQLASQEGEQAATAGQISRLAVIGEAVVSVAHETFHLLQRMHDGLDLLEFITADNPKAVDLVNGLRATTDRLSRMSKDVRAFAAFIQLDRRPYNVQDALREAWEESLASRGAQAEEIRLQLTGSAASCFTVDLDRVVGLLRNVFENALDACCRGEEIGADWREEATPDGTFVSIRLWNDGPPLSPLEREHVFTPFFSSKTRGTGLGMSIAERIAEVHGGTLLVSDGNTHAVEFVLRLPASAPNSHRPQ